jgi:predicted nucleic acid-binding protein
MRRSSPGSVKAFFVVLATEGDHLKAADIISAASAKGVVISTPHALIAAQALNRRGALLSTDADFDKLAKLTGLRLA